jgi:hypothetical protein
MSRQAARWIQQAHRGMLDELDASIALSSDPSKSACQVATVSEWAVHQHLEHLLLSDRAIVGWLNAVYVGEAESAGSGGPTWRGHVVMWFHMIPRGKGRAADFSMPTNPDMARIHEGLGSMRKAVEGLWEALPALALSRSTRRHHQLGYFTPGKWLRFAHIHHVHHRKIIDDILAVSTTG